MYQFLCNAWYLVSPQLSLGGVHLLSASFVLQESLGIDSWCLFLCWVALCLYRARLGWRDCSLLTSDRALLVCFSPCDFVVRLDVEVWWPVATVVICSCSLESYAGYVCLRVACFIESSSSDWSPEVGWNNVNSCAILVLADGGKSGGLFCTLVACCPEGLLLTRAFSCTNVLTWWLVDVCGATFRLPASANFLLVCGCRSASMSVLSLSSDHAQDFFKYK